MKRTAIKRGKPLARGTKRLAVRSKLRTSKPMRKVGRRGRASRRALAPLREAIHQSQAGCCARCSKRRKLDLHHLLSRARGGTDTLNNIVGLCRKCHDDVTFSTPPDLARWVLSAKGNRS